MLVAFGRTGIVLQTLPTQMAAVLLTGHGGLDKLEYRTDVPVPRPNKGEVLIRVGATAVNNTDINTRVGWYSKAITSGTAAIGATGANHIDPSDAAWSGAAVSFPRIQGADCCGRIVAIGDGVSANRVGERVLVRNMLRSYVEFRPFECWTFGAECDGGFAQFAKAPAAETMRIESDWSDAELASIPCAYSAAENMVHRANVVAGETALVTGASGGVGSAVVQLVRRRGANVIAITSAVKADEVRAIGAQQVLPRDADPLAMLGPRAVDVIIDAVGGDGCAQRLEVLKPGGRYAIAGAIAGPLATLDLRTIYLRDLTMFGCTFAEDAVYDNLVRYIEWNEIRPLVSKVYPLSEIKQAQQDFLEKGYVGKLVLIPP
jgi:NADPH:quinone reductase-like Zn-dependent oxidoreductase